MWIKNYRTIADREHRSLGGLSRGGGWTVQLGLEHPELFGALGLHSPAIFKDNAPFVEKIIQSIPQETRPKLWLDIGDCDMELAAFCYSKIFSHAMIISMNFTPLQATIRKHTGAPILNNTCAGTRGHGRKNPTGQ